jgi:hypothetical protein
MTQRERRIAAYMNLHGLSRAAAVKEVDAKPAPKTAKKNPARRSTAISGRKGLSKTGYINRPSQAPEHKAPSKRLKTRRKKALEAPQGYFPNPRKKNPLVPGLVARTRKAGSPKIKVFTVQYSKDEAGPWKTQGIFPTVGAARDYARALAGKNPNIWFRVTV